MLGKVPELLGFLYGFFPTAWFSWASEHGGGQQKSFLFFSWHKIVLVLGLKIMSVLDKQPPSTPSPLTTFSESFLEGLMGDKHPRSVIKSD